MASKGVVDVELVPKTDAPLAERHASPEAEMVLMFERLAKDPSVDVEKLERLIAMRERLLTQHARSAFAGAFARMQPDIPEIDERGQILVKGTLRSTYARLEDIHQTIKPILARHGFALRHRTEWPADKPNVIRIVGILSHEEGHSEESVFEAPADRSDFRTDIQSMGSTVSYGRRYTTLDLLNIATRRADNDGQGRAVEAHTPDGFDAWWEDLQSLADEGIDALTKFWQQEYKAHKPLCAYVLEHRAKAWAALKDRAERATKAQKAEAAR